MVINELVEQIIEKRKEKEPILVSKSEMLDGLTSSLNAFDDFKNEVVDSEGNLTNGRFSAIFSQHPEMIDNLNTVSTLACRTSIRNAENKLREAYRRFSRDRINISVVGKARIGKSRFLQSVTNLSDKVIPAFSDSDCTGAVSVIQNTPGTKLKAELTFKSETEMVNIVQDYLDNIISDKDKRMIVRSLNDIRDLNIEEVKKRISEGDTNSILVPYLEKFVYNFEEWVSCVREKETVLYDEDVIQTYVAQNNGEKEDDPARKNYYKYLAVKTCNIYCTFDYQEAGKITLLDTVGVSDNALGIDEEMLRVISEKSDATVFMHLPRDGAGGGISNDITAIYNKIKNNSANKNLGKWLFWLINYAPGSKTPNRIEDCNRALKTLEGNTSWYGAMKKIIDVSDQDQVREEFLIPLLNSLLDNLDEIDNLYLKEVQEALDNVKREYDLFCRRAEKVMESKLKEALSLAGTTGEIRNHYEKRIPTGLNKISREEKEKRDIPCDKLDKEVSKITAAMKNGEMVPSKEELIEELYANEQPVTIFTNCCNHIRNDITKRFSEVDCTLQLLVEELKNKVTMCLVSDDQGKLGKLINLDENQKPYEWLKSFAENVLDEEVYPNLYYAFMNLYNFDFSVKGFLTYEVRACLDLIDPGLSASPSFDAAGTLEFMAEDVNFWLRRNLKDVADDLTKATNNLMKNPHKAFFAAVKEFSDQVRFSDGVDLEWDMLLRENYRTIWKEEFDRIAKASASFKEWEDMLSEVLQYSKRPNIFSIY